MANPFTLRIPIRSFIFLLSLLTLQDAVGGIYYSRQNGSWNDTLTWSTFNHTGSNAATIPGASDSVFIGDGHSVGLVGVCNAHEITVGGGSTGVLFFNGSSAVQLNIENKLTVRTGAVLIYDFNASLIHEIRIVGDVVNNGTIDLVKDTDDHVRLVFSGARNSVVSESAGQSLPVWSLNLVSVEKTVKSYRVDCRASKFEDAIGQLNVVFGTYMHNNKGTFIVNAAAGPLTVGPDAVLQVSQGVLHLAQSSDRLVLQGKLQVTRGTMRIGNGAGRVGLLYEHTGSVTPEVVITGGTMVINGGIRPAVGHELNPFSFTQTGGTLRVNGGSVGTSGATFRISANNLSSFTMDGGLINIEKSNNSAGIHPDFDLSAGIASLNFSDGRVVFGNANTPSGTVFTFVPVSGAVFPHFTVSGAPSGTAILCPSSGNTADITLSSLKIETGKTFDVRSISGPFGDSRTLTLVNYFDNVHAFYNDGLFNARTGSVVFESTEGLGIGGGSTTSFYDLTINNPDGVMLWHQADVSNVLNLIDGKLYTSSANPIVLYQDAVFSGWSSSSYIDGPAHCWINAPQQQNLVVPVGKDNAFRPIGLNLTHTNSDTVLYKLEVINQSARAMNFTLPSTLTHVSSVRYFMIERGTVNNLAQASVELTYGQDDDVTDYRGLRIASDDGAAGWVDLGGQGTANSSGSILSSSFTSFNTVFTLANAVGFSNPLPVELLSFTAKLQKEVVVLDWATASELNSDFFEVQRSSDGFNYSALGRVFAAGNSNVLRRYSFNDNQPARGVNYYRLRQVDIDGTETYSPIRSVNFIPGRVTVYPNPVADRIVQISFPDTDESMNISLLRADGSLVKESVQSSFTAGTTEFRLSDAVQPGCYVIRMQSASGQVWQERLVVAQ